jgi:hypothetical protein
MRIRLKAVQFDPLSAPEVEVPVDWNRWIVQFARPLTRGDIDRVRRVHGLALGHYIPDFAYLERIDASRAANLRQDPLVRSVTPYLPEYKLDPDVTQRRKQDPAGDFAVIAEGYTDVSPEALLTAVRGAGYSSATSVRVPPGAAPRVRVLIPAAAELGALTRVREVVFIEPSPRMDIDRRDHSSR